MSLLTDDRAQAFALEGIIAAVIIASALLLGLQAVDFQPLTSGDERPNDELRTQVEDALTVAAESDDGADPVNNPSALREAATCVARDEGTLNKTVPSGGSVDPEQSAELAAILNETIGDDFSYIVEIEYPNASAPAGLERERLRRSNTTQITSPTVTVTRQIPVYDSDKFRGVPPGNPSADVCGVLPATSNTPIGGSGPLEFYVENDQHPESELYAVVQIRVIAW